MGWVDLRGVSRAEFKLIMGVASFHWCMSSWSLKLSKKSWSLWERVVKCTHIEQDVNLVMVHWLQMGEHNVPGSYQTIISTTHRRDEKNRY